MQLHMVDLRGQYLRFKSEIDAAVAGVLDTARFIRGPEVTAFEAELAQYVGGSHAIGVANGTDALQVAYMALGIGPGDEVITPSFTFIATAEAASIVGATPVFADIEPDTFNLDPASVAELITPRTKAIVPVHLFGQSADLDPILKLAQEHGIAVIEDNAQAIGATYKGRKTGSMGTLSTFSFFPSKNLGAYGDGGAVVTNDPDLATKVRMITNHGGRHKYYNELVGLNSRLDALQAAILRVKLRHLEEFTSLRQQAAQRYDALLSNATWITPPARAPWGRHVFHQYTLRVPERDDVIASLKSRQIPFGIYYPVPLHRLPVFADIAPAYDLPVTEAACEQVLSLPMHTELTAEQQAYVAEAVIEHQCVPVQ